MVPEALCSSFPWFPLLCEVSENFWEPEPPGSPHLPFSPFLTTVTSGVYCVLTLKVKT